MNIGRLSETKGHEYLIRAFREVLEVVEGHLLIAGKGEKKEYLETLVRDLGLSDRVHFLGWERNPFRYLARCDLFVSSSYRDGFSNALLEAMALDLPIIAADCDFGPRELLDEGRFGILVPIKNEKALREAMIRVLIDQNLRQQLRVKSRERIQSFRVEEMIRKYKELLIEGTIRLQPPLQAIKEVGRNRDSCP
jgi:glycosyltransferase involved in cell wall biosynthesis